VITHSSTGSTTPNRPRGSFGRTEEGIFGDVLGCKETCSLSHCKGILDVRKLSSAASLSLWAFKHMILVRRATSHSNFRSSSLIACHRVSAVTISNDIKSSKIHKPLLEHYVIEVFANRIGTWQPISSGFILLFISTYPRSLLLSRAISCHSN
jgi:hypothetical protein